MKKSTLLVVVGLLGLIGFGLLLNSWEELPQAALSAEERTWLEQNPDKLTLLYSVDFPPIESASSDGEFTGLSAEIIAMIERRLGVRFRMKSSADWGQHLAALESGACAIAPTIVRTAERERYAFFTVPYATAPVGIIATRAMVGNLTLDDLAGRRVAVVSGYATEQYVTDRAKGRFEVVPVQNVREGLRQVAFGQMDALVENLAVAAHYIQQEGLPNLRVAGSTDYVFAWSIGVSRHYPLLFSAIEKALAAIPESTLDASRRHWIALNADHSLHPKTWYRLKLAGLFIGLLLVGLGGISALLKRRLNEKVASLQQAYRELRANEQWFRAVFDHAPYGIAINHSDGRYLDVNQAYVAMTGLCKEELLSRRMSDLVHATEGETAALSKVLRQEGVIVRNVEAVISKRNGALIDILYSSVQLHINDEIQMLSIAVDITDKKRAEAALRHSEATLQSLFRAVPVGLAIVRDRMTLSVNEQICEIVGYSPAELAGHPLRELYDSDEEFEQVGQAIYGRLWERGSAYTETRFRRADGTWRDISIQAAPLQANDRRAGVAMAIQDITERKRTEAELQRHREHLEERVAERTAALEQVNADLHHAITKLAQAEKLAALGGLVAGIAHELNTPVGNAVLAASTLADRERDFSAQVAVGLTRSALQNFVDSVRDGSDILQRNLYRAAELISSFKQVAVDQSSYQRRDFALNEIVQEIALALSPRLRRSPVVLELAVASEVRLDSFPGPLGQVLMNLINNALIHAFKDREAGLIRIESLPAAPGRAGLRVHDNGNGIASEHLGRVFDPFFTTRLGEGGSGLGLHIVYNQITGILGGVIEVRSVVGEGTDFDIELPLIAPRAASAGSSVEAPDDPTADRPD